MMLQFFTRNKHNIPFFIAVSIVLINHLTGFIGYNGYDDISLAERAVKIIQTGSFFNVTETSSWQYPVVWLTALSYYIFGINDFAGAFVPLILTIGIILLVNAIIRNENLWIKFIVFALFLFTPWILYYSDKILPETFYNFFVFCSVIFYLRAKKRLLYALFFVVSLFMAFLTKVTAIFLIPAFLFIIIFDLVKKQNLRFWIWVLVSFLGIFIFSWVVFRHNATIYSKIFNSEIQKYLNSCSNTDRSFLYHISTGFWVQTIKSGFFLPFLFFIPALFDKETWLNLKKNNDYGYIVLFSAISMLSLLLIPVSRREFVFLCFQNIHFLYLVPFFSIIGGKVIFYAIAHKKHKFKLLFLAAFGAYLSGLYELEIALTLYWFLLVVVVAIYLSTWFDYGEWKLLIIIPLVLVLVAEPVKMYLYSRSVNYQLQKELVRLFFEKNGHKPALVITNQIQKQYGRLYTHFDTTMPVTFVSYNEVGEITIGPDTKIYLLDNPHTLYLNGQTENDLPVYARVDKIIQPILQKLKIKIFEIPDSAIIFYSGLQYSFNDFSHQYVQWEGNNSEDTSIFFSPPASSVLKPMQYSSTYTCLLDTLFNNQEKQIIVKAGLKAWYLTSPRGKLAISVNKNDKVLYFESVNLEDVHKERRVWKEIALERLINEFAEKQCTLKVFFWNVGLGNIWIDDFRVELLRPRFISRKKQ